MEWLIIYLLVQIEVIAATIGKLFFFLPLGAIVMGGVVFVAGLASIDHKNSFADLLRSDTSRLLLKWCRRFVYVGLFALIVPGLIPTQKNMAIIVGTGIVYNVVTSDTATRVGNKAIGALEKKIDEILGDEDTVVTPEPKAESKAEPSSAQVQSL